LDKLAPLADEFRAHGRLPALRLPDGSPKEDWDYLGLYGCLLPAWGVTDPELAARLLETVIEPSRDGRMWGDATDYYAQNLLWFGMALHLNGAALPGAP
jgi:hypothetical protein